MAPLLNTDTWDDSARSDIRRGTDHPKDILYVDAYDSFSYNVVAMLEETLGVKVTVITTPMEDPR